MGRFGRKLLPCFVVTLFAFALPAFATDVTVNGTANFSSLDGSVDDADHLHNGVFTVNGDLTINGKITCSNSGGNNEGENQNSPCSMKFAVSGNVLMSPGSSVAATNGNGGEGDDEGNTDGGGANITFTVGGDVTLKGAFGTQPGALISSSSGSGGDQSTAGFITITSNGKITAESKTVINASSKQGGSGKILVTAAGKIDLSGLIASGPSGTLLSSRLTGQILSGGSGNQHGGEIRIQSNSLFEPGITVGSTATIVSQGETTGAGPVTLEACGLVIKGLVADVLDKAGVERVVLRSGKGMIIDGTDLGVSGATTGRLGHVRADSFGNWQSKEDDDHPTTAPSKSVDLFANDAIQVLGPDPALSALYAVTSVPDTNDKNQDGGRIRVISLRGTVTGSGRVFNAGEDSDSNSGGTVAISSKGNVNLDHGYLTAIGDATRLKHDSAGGHITARSYSGNVIWTSGRGDVRPVGAGASNVASQGTIALTACGTVSTSGTTFPTNGPAVGVFPTITTGSCSLSAPTLPAGEPALQVCCNVITITNPSVTSGAAGVAFSQTFTQTGAIGAATFSIVSGTLPTGLSFAATGTLSGTPTVTGSFPITVKVTDSQGCTGIGTTYNLQMTCPTITVTNPAVNSGVAAAPFSQTFTQSGGVGATTFSLASGTLPTGLTLASNGVLSGTPTKTGTFPITVKATDSNGCTGTGPTYTLTITCQIITVTNPGVNTGVAGAPFSQTFTQSGGIGTTTFSLASGTLPAGLTLASNGTLSGAPTQTGSFPITVKATDSNGCTGTGATYTLTITCQTITVTNPAVTSGVAGAAFSQTFTQSGGIGTTTFSLASGTLPAGLTLAANGTLSGSPTQTGSFPITVKATDANGCNGTGATYTLTIACQTITVTNPAVSTGVAGSPFSQNFTQSNGIGATTFTLASGTLPSGLTLAANGTLSGTPAVVGTFPITVKVTDANGCTGTGATYNLAITCQTITVTPPAVNSGVAGSPFSQTFTQSGAIGTATFSLASGVLPSGISLAANGVLSGTPLQTGSFPIAVKVTDSNGCTGTASYTLTIVCQTIAVTNPAVNSGVAATPFSQTFTQSGAIGTATFSLASGTLPAGMTLSASGVLSGTPAQTGTFPITVAVTDSNGCGGVGAIYNLTITCQTITVTNPAVNIGIAGQAFSQSFTQSGAIGAGTFTLASGTLPSGLSLAANGTLAGVPLQAGTFPITVQVTDSNGCTGTSATYNLTINCQTITVTHPANMTGTVGVAFSQQYTQSGGIGTVVFSTVSTVPAGMSLAADGTLSGTPTQSGSFPITVTATDSNGCTGSDTFTLTIGCQTITVTNPAVSTGTVGTPFSQTFTQSGASGTATFSLASGTLPAGLSLSAAGVLSGTPGQTGSFPITVKVTDSNGCTGTGPTYTLVISCQTITVTNPATTTGTVGAPFSQTFTQSGGIGAVTFTTASTLPTGLSLSTSGVLSGTPTQTGTFPITVMVADSNGCTGTGPTYTLVIVCQTITVNTPVTTTGTVDAPFGQAFTQSGAIGTAMFSLASGLLPTGLTLSSTGLLSGTPQVPGSFPITVTVTDSNGCTGTSGTYTLVIACQTITVTNPSSTTGTYNAPLSGSFTFTQTGVGTHTPAVFTVNSGSLPSGVSLSSSGVLSGMPTQTGVFSITVKVTDANGCSGIGATYTLTIGPNLTTKAYADVGNTQLDGGLPAPATPTVVSVAVSNGDSSDAPITYAVTVPPAHGTLTTFNANGTFLYTPNVGNTTADSFTYNGTSNGVTVTRTATISFTGRVWYVDNATVSGTNDGRSNTPFKTMTAVGGAGTASGDFIYVSKGTGSTTGSYTMLASQQLIGAGATLNVGAGTLVVPGSAANTPTLSGTLTLASSVTVNGIDMSTGAASAISGTTVTSINVTVRNLTTTTGTGVVIGGIGSSGTMTFTQINAGTVSAGPANAVSLSNFSGSLTVTGDGSNAANGSGGTIQKTTGNAISLASVNGTGVSLASMIIKNSAHDGIHGTILNNFALLGCQVLSNGTTTVDNGIHLFDVSGVATFTNDTVTGSFVNNVWIDASATSTSVMTSLTVTNGSYSSSANDNGFLVSLNHSAAINTATITGATFSNNFSSGLQMAVNGNSTIGNGAGAPATGTATVTGCTFTGNGSAAADFDQGGAGGVSNMYARFINNLNITGNGGPVVNVFSSSSSAGGTMKARIDGNHIGNVAIAGSGSLFGPGIRVFLQGKTLATVTVVNNFVRQTPGSRGIDVEALGPVTTGQPITVSDITITGNDVDNNDTSGFAEDDVYLAADNQGSAAQVRAEVHGNKVKSGPGCADFPGFSGNEPWMYFNIAAPGAVGQLVNFGGHVNAAAELAATNFGDTGADPGGTLIAGPINTAQ